MNRLLPVAMPLLIPTPHFGNRAASCAVLFAFHFATSTSRPADDVSLHLTVEMPRVISKASNLLRRDAEQMLFTANEEFVVNRRRGGIDRFIH